MKRLSIAIVLFNSLIGCLFSQGDITPKPEHIYLKNQIYPENNPYILENKNIKDLSIMDCKNIIIRNCDIIGSLKIEGSLDKGVDNLLFDGCLIHDVEGQRLGFICGNFVTNITCKGCGFIRSPYEYHAFYLSAGHFNPDSKIICKGFKFINCYFAYTPGGRNTFQENGEAEDILMDGCWFVHAQLNGATFIGCQSTIVRNCVFYGNNRGCIIIKNYIDSNYWVEDGTKDLPVEEQDHGNPEKYSYDHWKKSHCKNKNILIENNTFMVGPKAFYKGPGNHEDDPTDGHPVIAIVNSVPWVEYESENIIIMNNIFHTPNNRVIQIDENEAKAVSLIGNMVYVTKPGWPYVDYMDKLNYIQGNWIEDPKLQHPFYWYIDGWKYPNYDWSKHPSGFSPKTFATAKYGVGIKEFIPGKLNK